MNNKLDDQKIDSLNINFFYKKYQSTLFLNEDKDLEIYAVDDTTTGSTDDFSSVTIRNKGFGIDFSKDFNETNWLLKTGIIFKKERIGDKDDNLKPYGDLTPTTGNISEIFCIGYNDGNGECFSKSSGINFKNVATYNNLDNNKDPSFGNKLILNYEEFFLDISGEDTQGTATNRFRRIQADYDKYLSITNTNLKKSEVNKFVEGGIEENCYDIKEKGNNINSKILKFRSKIGKIMGNYPIFESFGLGGSESVRGWRENEIAVAKTVGEISLDYKIQISEKISLSIFIDYGTSFGTQDETITGNIKLSSVSLPGVKIGEILEKPGSGFSFGTNINYTTDKGNIKLEGASKNLEGLIYSIQKE